MAIEALILFGSHARGDDENSSDWDIIAVSGNRSSHPYENGALSISFYSRHFLFRLAETGNLFALHIVTEGKAIYDPSNLLQIMKSKFVKKINYNKDKSDASMLGYFLLRHASRVTDWKIFNRRLAWCVRTILIASAFEQGHILFSSKSLSGFFSNDDAAWLIKNKNSAQFDERSQFRMVRFLRDFGLGDPHVYDVDDILSHIEYIFRSDNIVGKNTIASLFGAEYNDYAFERRQKM